MTKLKLTPRQRKFVDELDIEQAVIVPSTTKGDKPISQTEYKKRIEKVKRYLSKRFGGYTAVKGSGGYYSNDRKKMIHEKVARVVSFSENPKFKKHKPALIKQLGKWGKEWKQESVGYENEGDLYYIKTGIINARKHRKRMSPTTRRKLLRNLAKARRVKARLRRKR